LLINCYQYVNLFASVFTEEQLFSTDSAQTLSQHLMNIIQFDVLCCCCYNKL